MNSPFSYRRWCVGAIVLVLILALAACSPFGRQAATEAPPTETPVPPDTPIPAVPTHTSTPTRVVEAATATATTEPTSAPAEPAEPTPTPSEAVGGEEKAEVKKVSYTAVRSPKIDNVIRNGSFEDGFQEQGVALQWSAYDNGGAVYAWVADDSIWHVSHGSSAQLMRIMGPTQPDRFVGIYQTVDVVAGEVYTLAVHGVVRSSTANNDSIPYGHRVQWAIDYEGKADWPAMNADWGQWTDPGWNDVRLDEDKPVMNVYVKEITPTTDKLTVYIRGWTKWPIMNSEAKYYVDGVFLKGPVPGEEVVEEVPTEGGDGMPTTGGTGTWIPVLGAAFILGFGLWELRKAWRR